MSFIFGGETGQTQDSITDARRRMAIAQLQQGMQSSPIQSPWQGVARLSEALMGGLAFRRQADQEREANSQVMSAISGQPYTPPAQSPGFLSSLFGNNNVPASGAQGQMAAANPSAAVGHASDMSGLDSNHVYNGFMDTVKGGVSNPYALAAIASTGKAESGYDPKNAGGSWNDGANNAGGIMSWNGPRLANLQKFAGGTNGTPQQQGQFFLQENPALIASLNKAGSVEEAQHLMNNAWAFKGYNQPGNSNAANRLATAQAFLPKFAGQGGAAPNQVASLNPSAGMGAPQQPYRDPMVTTAYQQAAPASSGSPAMQAIQQQAPLPGPGGTGGSPATDPTQTASVGPMQPPQAVPPLDAPVNIPNQPISNPMPLDRSGVGMGGAAPGPGAFPTAPGDGPARLAAALQGAQQGPQGAPPQQQLAQAMQGQQGGAQGSISPLAGNPRAQALMQAMMNPYASPQARQMAGSMLQMQMAPQLDFVTRPDGSIVAINKLTGQVAGNPVGAMKNKSWGVINKDEMGRETYGWIDPLAGTVTPGPNGYGVQQPPPNNTAEGGQGQPQAAPQAQSPAQGQPQPAPQQPPQAQSAQRQDSAQNITIPRVKGEDYLDGIKNDPQWGQYASQARAILRGDVPFPTGTAATKPADVMPLKLALAADPTLNASVAAARGATIKDFTTSDSPTSMGGKIIAANTAIRHVALASQLSEELGKQQARQYGVFGGPPGGSSIMNKAQEALSSNSSAYHNALTKYDAITTPMAGELETIYSSGGGSEAGREAMKEIGDPNSTPEQRRGAFQTILTGLQDKTDEMQRKWHQGIGPNSQDFPIIGPESKMGINYVSSLGKNLSDADQSLQNARSAILGGAPRHAVEDKLKAAKIDPAGL